MARKILLADDSVTAQNMGRKILADAGYEVITVNNGSAALKKIGEQRPDLIVLDVYMPGYSGLEVCQRLKDVGDTAQIPILLTVGKLEPFKPEEAKRARADGFIVKPFEASELLSALSKLEDKVVPRSESSKPGRSGRSHAAFEESRYDKTMSVEEDTGWKNRIAFPSKKKEKEKEAEREDTSSYRRPVERELQNPVEPKAVAAARNGKSEEERFDLGALAAAGLPKDVTPEEIAALAAAAARVKERLAQEEKAAQSAPEMAVVRPAEPEVQDQAVEIKPEVQAAPAKAAATAVPEPEQKAPEAAETKSEQKTESSVPASAELASEVAESKPEPAKVETVESGNGAASHSSEVNADEPVTMAVGAGANAASSSRWTAVAVALAPEESGISLEHEMQKAYAAFAAAESGHSAATAAIQASEIASNAPSAERAELESASAVPATIAPEAAHSLSAVASAAHDAVRAAVEELQSVAASYLKPKATEPDAPALETSVKPAAEAVATAIPEAAVEPEAAQAAAAPVAHTLEESKAEESRIAESTNEELKPAEAEVAVAGAAASESAQAMPAADAPEVKAEVRQESDLAATTAAAWADWQRIRETSPSESAASPRDVAAMAAAAGAERRPEDVPSGSESDPAIASIVDSVLNDLRPKIVEEISRKLGKRK